MPWESPRFDACTSWICLGVTWTSPSLRICPSFISSYHSSLPTLENSLHTKLHTIFISNVSVIKIINPLWFSFNTSLTPIKTLPTVTTSFEALPPKEHQKKEIKTQMQILAEICQNRTADKSRIFKGFSVPQIKKCSTNESLDITWGI